MSKVQIYNNDKINDLTGLENLINVERILFFSYNDNLADISALSNLTSMGGFSISNSNIISLAGLENVNTINEGIFDNFIGVVDNPLLSDISALDILPYYESIDKLNIYGNPNLSMCSEQGICYYLASGRPSDIYGNMTGCNSDEEILNTCTITEPTCPPGDVMLTSQAQVDSFAIRYPNCVRIYGNLTIGSDSIANINALSGITTIDSDLNICNNPSLISLNGLSSPIDVGGNFRLKNNDAITFVTNEFSLNGGGIFIEDNDALENIGGISNFVSVVNYLKITNNPNLSYCSPLNLGTGFNLQDICVYLFNNNPNEIYNNQLGCNSADEILNIGTCSFLPITLTDFQAKIDNKSTLLTWETATESNNAGFEIQRSADAINWEKIAWQDGQGTTTTAHTYTHRDENPLFGTSYYRLKQVDFDGAFEYTDIVQVNYQGRDISIYPNPVKNTLHISDLDGEDIQHISIYDQTGSVIHSGQMSDNTIDVSEFSPGMYILKIAMKGEILHKKFIVQERK